MITGASSGIGRATALGLAQLGARLVLVCRDRDRAERVRADIERATGNRDVLILLADLSSQQAIRQVAKDFFATAEPLHVLINNAGVANARHTPTIDGIETVFAVNHLAYFLLTNLLLPCLKESAPARVVNVASDAHRHATINFEDLGGERRYQTMRIYGQSKLANILFTYELARRLAGSNVTVNALHPGFVASNLGKNNGLWARVLLALLRPFARSNDDGAATSIYLAASPEVQGISGKYFKDCKLARSSSEAEDQTVARRLWDLSAQMTGLDVQTI
jgi:NAD(P)-dependent dehydrogenase (short-subunit alcohol dehydrogenase family)